MLDEQGEGLLTAATAWSMDRGVFTFTHSKNSIAHKWSWSPAMRFPRAQFEAQEVGEQVVVPEATPASVERDQEQLSPMQIPEELGAVVASGHVVAHVAVELIEHRRRRREDRTSAGFARQHLVDEQLGDALIGTVEAGDEHLWVDAIGQGESGKTEPGSPAFGPSHQGVDIIPAPGTGPRSWSVMRGSLPVPEAEVGEANLTERAGSPHSTHSYRWISRAGDHDVHRRG